ncbi:hypothetical protein ACFX13_012181 [Malus domestica]|uniref:Uncharacterized protein n=2 Tax=Malus TaxID=3749 RepID=A0A498IEM4_MALDO|nr:hypothetical protein DVH24_041178 [Malus domestica]TQD69002.1 hypothetical protein C1H46_045465 [Malus baccata]
MGKQSSLFSFCNIFKACFSSGSRDDAYYSDDGGVYVRRRMCPSDEDRGGWTAEPGIDRKATAFISRFYASRVSDPECQTFAN